MKKLLVTGHARERHYSSDITGILLLPLLANFTVVYFILCL